jgi:hypothetical protein
MYFYIWLPMNQLVDSRRAAFVALLVAGILMIPLSSAPVFADTPPWAGNPHIPGVGVIGVVDTTNGTDCDIRTATASDTKGGVYVKFVVPSTISTVQNSGHPENGVNIHAAFYGEDGLYREVGMYYGNWRAQSGIGYNPNVFQYAYGVADANGGLLRGVLNLPVVAGHTVELYFIYLNSAGQWQVWYDDLNDGLGVQAINVGSPGVRVKSDYSVFIEALTQGPNSNSQALGLVEVMNVQAATKIVGDGVSLSTWADGFVASNCSPANGSYGVTNLTPAAHFKLGYGGTQKTNGFQLW